MGQMALWGKDLDQTVAPRSELIGPLSAGGVTSVEGGRLRSWGHLTKRPPTHTPCAPQQNAVVFPKTQ